MKVLILSVTAGYGHHATAQAIGDMLKNKGAEVDTLDVYAYISNLIKTTIDKGYLFSSKHMQTLYRLVYQLAENNGASYFSSAPSIINIINALGATKFARVISDREPDVIICTHVFAAQMVDELNTAAGETNATSGIVVFLLSLVTCNIYSWYWFYKAGELVNRASGARGGTQDQNRGILYLILSIIGLNIISMALIQDELNKLA